MINVCGGRSRERRPAEKVGRPARWSRRAILCGSMSFVFLGSVAPTQAQESIKVGLLLTYVGPTAIFARYEDKGARMRIDEVNQAGGINGRKIELVNYDTEGKPDRAGTLFRRLAQDDKVAAVIGPDSIYVLLGMSAVPSEVKVFSMAAPGNFELVAPKDRDYIASAWTANGYTMELGLAYLKDKLHVNRVAMLTTADSIGEMVAKETADFAKLAGMDMVQVVAQPASDRDLLPSLTKLTALKPPIEGLVVFGSGPYGTIAVNQSDLAGVQVPIVYIGGNVIPELIKDVTPETGKRTFLVVARSVVADTLPPGDPFHDVVKKFNADYQARYNEPATEPSAVGYDMAQTVVDALQHVGPDPAKIRDYIYNNQKDFLAVQGIRINRTPGSPYGIDPRDVVVASIENGKFVFKGYLKDSFTALGIKDEAIRDEMREFKMLAE